MADYTGDGGDNTFTGTADDELIRGLNGADTLDGGGGMDTLKGAGGNDRLADGDDDVGDRLYGGEGDDAITAGRLDRLYGGMGIDDFILRLRTDTGVTADLSGLVAGGSITFEQTTISGFESGTIFFGSGDDLIVAAQIPIAIVALEGDDTLTGGAANDSLNGGDYAANDTDQIGGGDGADTLQGGAGDILDGGAGTDRFYLVYTSAASRLREDFRSYGGVGALVLDEGASVSGCESGDLTLSGRNDVVKLGDFAIDLHGGAGDDRLTGGSLWDQLEGGEGDDDLNGNGGSDTAVYLGAASAVTVDLSIVGVQDTGGAGFDELSSIENLRGSLHDDILSGDDGDNTLFGSSGNDQLNGGDGDDGLFGSQFFDPVSDDLDRMYGGKGSDFMGGGPGIDSYVYRRVNESRPGRHDAITDLEATDIIDLEAIDADTTQDGDQEFALRRAFGGVAGEMILTRMDFYTLLSLDTDGDAAADAEILLYGDQTAFDNFVF